MAPAREGRLSSQSPRGSHAVYASWTTSFLPCRYGATEPARKQYRRGFIVQRQGRPIGGARRTMRANVSTYQPYAPHPRGTRCTRSPPAPASRHAGLHTADAGHVGQARLLRPRVGVRGQARRSALTPVEAAHDRPVDHEEPEGPHVALSRSGRGRPTGRHRCPHRGRRDRGLPRRRHLVLAPTGADAERQTQRGAGRGCAGALLPVRPDLVRRLRPLRVASARAQVGPAPRDHLRGPDPLLRAPGGGGRGRVPRRMREGLGRASSPNVPRLRTPIRARRIG